MMVEDRNCPVCGVSASLAEARRRVALNNKPKYASDILDGAWDDMPAIRRVLSEVRHEQLAEKSA